MSRIKKTGIRVIRKSAHLSNKVLRKGTHFTERVEDKATRIITGKDLSTAIHASIPVEQVLFNGIKYNMAPLNPALPAVGRPGKVTLLIPSLNKGSFFGGTATALIVAGKLAERLKMPLRIIETLAPGGKDGLGSFFEANGIGLVEDVELIDVSARTYERYGYIDLHPDDVLMASAWWDARLLARLPLKKPFIYLIQDFEPIFYPNSGEYVLAEETYHTANFIPLCNTELMYTFMCKNGYSYIEKNGIWFEPAVSKHSMGVSIPNTSKRRMFLYGRPNVARNLFYVAVDAINRAFSEGLEPGEWEIFMAGQDKLPNITLSTGAQITNLGKMNLDDYSDFVRTIDLAVSPMMAPHPNYPTLEFASVGATVVTTKYETKQDLTKYSPNIYMADLSVDSIAKNIVAASQKDYDTRMKDMKLNNIPEDWELVLAEVLKTVTKRLG